MTCGLDIDIIDDDLELEGGHMNSSRLEEDDMIIPEANEAEVLNTFT